MKASKSRTDDSTGMESKCNRKILRGGGRQGHLLGLALGCIHALVVILIFPVVVELILKLLLEPSGLEFSYIRFFIVGFIDNGREGVDLSFLWWEQLGEGLQSRSQ